MPGKAPLEGLAADWIAPRDVISRQQSLNYIAWASLPGCLHALHQSNSTKLPYSCPLSGSPFVFAFFFFSFSQILSLPQPPSAPPFIIPGACPSRKLFLDCLLGSPTTERQNSRWAIWLAVSLCLFPRCLDVRWDKTLFCCICHDLSAGFTRNEKSLGYWICGLPNCPMLVRGVPVHLLFSLSLPLSLFIPFFCLPKIHFSFCFCLSVFWEW